MKGNIKTKLFVAAGSVSMGIGIIGIFVPLLPTTPFLLLAAICFFRSSQRLYDALLRNRFTGTYIRNYLEGRGMPTKMKAWTLGLMWFTIICSALFFTENLAVRIILGIILSGVTLHILMVKTMKNPASTSSSGIIPLPGEKE
jgi:uncharacterized protein